MTYRTDVEVTDPGDNYARERVMERPLQSIYAKAMD